MKRLVLFLIFAAVLVTPALGASDLTELEDALPESARQVLGGVSAQELTEDAQGLLARLGSYLEERARSLLSTAARSACTVLTVTLLCSAAAAAAPDGKLPPFVLMGGAVAIMGACAGDMRSYLSQAAAALGDLSDFSKALLPCVATAAAATGHAASGAARYAASALCVDVLMTLGQNVVLPTIYAYGAVCTANAALPEGALAGPAKLMAWLCRTLLTALTTAFTLGLAITGVIAGTADKLAGSVAKTAISAALPVVGSILSDAADAYLAGAQLLRGAVGAFGLAAVLAVCLGPVLGLGAHYLLYKAAACVCEPFADGRLSKLIGDIGTAYGMALGLVGSAAAMLFVAVVLGTEVLTL